jgi:hypothetical protein
MRARANRVFDEEEDDMADFIEEDSPDEEDREREDRQARKTREKARRKQRREEGFALSNLDITAEYVCCSLGCITWNTADRSIASAEPGMKFKRSSVTGTTMMMHSSPTRMKKTSLLQRYRMFSSLQRSPTA